MSLLCNEVDAKSFNRNAKLPFGLRLKGFEMAMQDVYDFFYDVNLGLIERGLQRLDDMLRPAIMSGVLSDMLTASLAKHSRSLTINLYHNGHPDLVVNGIYPDNKVKAGSEGVEIKATRKAVVPWTLMAHAINGCACLSMTWITLRSLLMIDRR
ncbi:MAG: hypothetical protein ACREJN_19855 [Nitrospiraceae bacterium]